LRKDLQQVPELFVEVLPRHGRQPEEVLPLVGPDDHRDAGGESRDHRVGNELDDGAEARNSQQQQDHAGQQSRDLQAVDAVSSSDACENDDEGAGRTRDLHPTAAEQRNHHAGDDRRVEPLLRLGALGNREGHRQRQRHDTDDESGDDVTQPL
jgi:hypothetical protein